jgi:predicted transcriptional regulator
VSIDSILSTTLSSKAIGPKPSYAPVHVIKSIELIRDLGPIGRARLSKELRLGEGSVKTLLKRLKELDIITTNKKGCILTSKGVEIGSWLKTKIPSRAYLGKTALAIGEHAYALLIRNIDISLLRTGLEQRDAALLIGALGASTLVVKDDKIILLPDLNINEKYPKEAEKLYTLLKPQNGDVIIIGTANDPLIAEFGALSAFLASLKLL